jgi:hypothetical protein
MEEKKIICQKCKCENLATSLFCSQCSEPLTQEAKIKKLGWWIVFYDFSLPGLGHYMLGLKKLGLILMGLFLIFFTLYVLDSAQRIIAMFGDISLTNGSLSVENITQGIEESRTLWGTFLSWSWILIWIGTLINSLLIKFDISIKKD